MPGELLTLQLGSYANYVGAHYWNLQDELLGCAEKPEWQAAAGAIDSEVLLSWREDKHGNLQYYPRTVLVDVQGSLGGVSFSADAASRHIAKKFGVQQPACDTWQSGVEVHAAEPVTASQFNQQLFAAEDVDEDDEAAVEAHQAALEAAAAQLAKQGGVEYWTDFLKAPLHPSSPLALPGVWSGVSDTEGFGGASAALLGSAAEVVEAADDKLRWWAEQCDSLQGLQVMSDDMGGYGALGCQVLEVLQDAYPKAPVLYYSLRRSASGPPADTMARARLQLSECLSLAQAGHASSLYIPLACPWRLSSPLQQLLRLDPSSTFQAAAVLAAAVESITLPCRLTGSSSSSQGGTDLHSLVQLLAGRCPSLAATSLQLPTGALPPDDWAQAAAADTRLGTPAAAGSEPHPLRYLQLQEGVLNLMAVPTAAAGKGKGKGNAEEAAAAAALDQGAECITLRGVRKGSGLAAVPAVAGALDQLLGAEGRMRTVTHRCVVGMPLALPLPFPPLFTTAISAQGDVCSSSSSSTSSGSSSSSASTTGVTSAPNGPAQKQQQQQQQEPAASGGCHVTTCPQLTRLRTSARFTEAYRMASEQLRSAAASMAGGHFLRAWDYCQADVVDIREQLMHAAGRYEDAESEDDL